MTKLRGTRPLARAVRRAGIVVSLLLLAASAVGAVVQLRVDGEASHVAFRRVAGGYRFENRDGVWTILTGCRRGAGPGYVSGFVTREGIALVADERGAGVVNDPVYGGLGAFGWHASRGRAGHVRLGFADAWDVSGRTCARASLGFGAARVDVLRPQRRPQGVPFGVDVLLAAGDRPLVRVRYRYLFRDSGVDVWTLVDARCPRGACAGPSPSFVKEPKLVARLDDGTARYSRAATFDSRGRLVCTAPVRGAARGPILRTAQCGADDRARVRFDWGDARSGGDGRCERGTCFNVVMRAWDPERGVLPWENGRAGLDGWAVAAARRPAAHPRDGPGEDGVRWGCHGGSPAAQTQRRWETAARREPLGPPLAVGVLFPAWEGGRGAYDCEPLARALGPARVAWGTFSSYSLGDGWRLGSDDAPPGLGLTDAR